MQVPEPSIKKSLRNAQGVALSNALRFLETEHVDVFRQTEQNGYIISLASEEAEGMYSLKNGSASWQKPEGETNQHFEVVVQDADDLRFVSYLDITVKAYDENNEEVASETLEYLWHPVISHYGKNTSLPGDGPFRYEVSFAAPTFMRHDEVLGDRLTKDVSVTFDDIKIERDQDKHGAE